MTDVHAAHAETANPPDDQLVEHYAVCGYRAPPDTALGTPDFYASGIPTYDEAVAVGTAWLNESLLGQIFPYRRARFTIEKSYRLGQA